MTQSFRAAMFVLLATACDLAGAVIPESGLYWNSDFSGTGYTIDVQNGRVVVVVFTHDRDGRTVFYNGAGDLVEARGEVLGFGYPLVSAVGYDPWHYVGMELYRVSGGPCLGGCAPTVPDAMKVGGASFFFDRLGWAYVQVRLDDGQGHQRLISKMLYAYAPPARRDVTGPPMVQDLRGEWVFVDRSNLDAPAVRARFTTQSPADLGIYPPRPWTVTFTDGDAVDGYTMVCRSAPPGPGMQPDARQDACELRRGGRVLYWARLDDLGVDRMLLSTGATPNQGAAFRGAANVVGMRLP